jgi:hypothetical protein
MDDGHLMTLTRRTDSARAMLSVRQMKLIRLACVEMLSIRMVI